MAFLVSAGVFLADQTGVVNISNAVEGEDLATGRQLSAGERVFQGALGGFSLFSSATGGLNMIRSGIRSTGQCAKLGKYFTDCCFISTTQVYTRREVDEIAVVVEDADVAISKDELEITVNVEANDTGNLGDEDNFVTLNNSLENTDIHFAMTSYEPIISVNSAEGVNAVGEPLEYLVCEPTVSNGVARTVVVSLAVAGAVLYGIGTVCSTRKRSVREQAFADYQDDEGLDCDLPESFLLERAREWNLGDKAALYHESNIETSDATYVKNAYLPEQPQPQELALNDTAQQEKKSARSAEESKEKKSRMRNFNWLTITGVLLMTLAATLAWLPSEKSVTRKYADRAKCATHSSERNVCRNVEQFSDQAVVQNALNTNEPATDADVDGAHKTTETAPNTDSLQGVHEENTIAESESEFESTSERRRPNSSDSKTVAVQETSAQRAKVYEDVLVAISEIKIGDRTPGVNPQGNDGADESCFAEIPHYIYSLRYIKENGTACNIQLLRPYDWLASANYRICNRLSGTPITELDLTLAELSPSACPITPSLEVWLDLDEMDCVGWAKIVDIDNSFQYKPGEGNLVTGTFQHEVSSAVDLYVEGQEEPIGVTETHPFWSVDREDFVPVGELVEGERLLLFNGETKRVTQRLPRPGPECVYNLEVLGEHVYLVTKDGLLVHNNCISRTSINGRPTPEDSEEFYKRALTLLFGSNNVTPQTTYFNRKYRDFSPGNVRPDFRVITTIPGTSGQTLIFAEVKNYDLRKGLRSLISRTKKQLSYRVNNLPQGSLQVLLIDARGQGLSIVEVSNIINRINNKLSGISGYLGVVISW